MSIGYFLKSPDKSEKQIRFAESYESGLNFQQKNIDSAIMKEINLTKD